MVEAQKTFPNIPVTSWTKLRGQFKKTIPVTISSNYLASVLDVSEASAKSNITPTLKQIGLIDDEGKTIQEIAKKFRDDNLYEEFCTDIIKKIYPQELIDAFPDKDSDKSKVLSWFMNHTGVGEAGARRMVAFYSILIEANPNVTKATSSSKSKEQKDKPIKVKKTKSVSKIENRKEAEENPSSSSSRQLVSPELNINIQIHISSDASPDMIKSIFENMAKYIYKV
jgi:hypothetical protein